MYMLTVNEHFASSHSLRDYEGKCKNLHGHTWKVQVVVQGQELNSVGMLVDFKELKQSLREVVSELDHQHLNGLEYFQKINPTSENIARFIFEKIEQKGILNIDRVTVWESENASATYCL